MAFCTNCGKSVNPGDRFCGSCGQPMTAPVSVPPPASVPPPQYAPPPQPAPPPPNVPPPQYAAPQYVAPPQALAENVIGAFPVSRKKGMFTQESFHLILTTRRLIFAAFTNEMIKQAAKEEGKGGFLSGMVGAMTLGYNYYKHYLNMDPEVALRENPQNFVLDISRIRKVKLEMGRKQAAPRNQGIIHKADVYDNSKLEIETIGEKHVFAIAHHFHTLAADTIRKSGLM